MVIAKYSSNFVGIIGNTTSIGIFLLPAPTFYSMWKKQDIDQEFQFHPHLLKVQVCLLWIFYGLPVVKPDRLLIATCNGLGLVVELVYLATFCFCDRENKGRTLVALGLAGEVIFTAVIVVVTLLDFHTQDNRALLVGMFCVAFSVVMSSCGLGTMKKVIDTQDVESMPFNVSLANLANDCFWAAYALITTDHFVFFSYGIGALCSLAQLIVYACYYKPENDVLKLSKIHPSSG
ncbi:conserved hypothetical protein [Ricinus communis]|uniref:Bidirectional sugar transporter SWEET n=1 Tax=Ricinus communis TaxID=3988 RepID=B9SSR8_RICCO|nr:conserved hypothetical protein [Ricinus communis]|eukprot:XP_002529037.1 bidirectional sugar transporter SWEET4 isoform X1 [Ricinus communis]